MLLRKAFLAFRYTDVSHVRLNVPALYSIEEHFPTVHCLPRPYPDAGSDAHDHGHEVLDHEHLKPGVALGVDVSRTGHGVLGYLAHVLVPGGHPVLEVGVFVNEARYHDQSWQGVEYGEDAYPDHEFFQFVRFGAVVFHHRAYPEEGDEAGSKENGAEDQVDDEGDQDEHSHRLHVPDAHVAYSA